MFDQTNQTMETMETMENTENMGNADTNAGTKADTDAGNADTNAGAGTDTGAGNGAGSGAEMPDSIFDDAEDMGGAPEGAEAEKPTAEKPGEEKPEATVHVKFNGEEKEIPISEAVQLAQKGMNYDHIKGELEQYRTGAKSAFERELGILDAYARKSGLTREEYVKSLEEGAARAELDDAVSKLQKQYPDAPEDLLRRMAELEHSESAARQEEMQRAELDKRTKPWKALFKEFPEVNVNTLPEAVLKAVEAGKTPTEAYQAYLLAEARKKAQIAEQHGYNKARAVGSVRGDAAETDKDPFLEGFGATI